MNFFTRGLKNPKTTYDDSPNPSLSPSERPAFRSNRSRDENRRSASTRDDSYGRSASATARATFRPSNSRDENRRPASSRKGSSHKKASTSRANPFDPTSHPLNLPPDQLRRLSALSRMNEPMSPDPMEVDHDGINGESVFSSPVTESMPGAFTIPANGVNGTKSQESINPTNKSNPSSPVEPPAPTPEDAEAFKTAGNKFYKAREYRKAIDEYSKAVAAQPTSATYLNNRAAAYISNGQYTAALQDAIRADELDPNNPKVLLRLARIYTSLGRPEEALATYGRIQPPPSAKDLAPAKSMLQHISVAEDALKNGTTGSMALHALDQADRLLGVGAPKPRKWLLMRGEAYLKMGNINALGDAQGVAMSLLRSNKLDPDALVLRGRALYAQGDNQAAIQHFRQALNCDPDFRDAVKYLRMVQKLDRMKEEGNKEYKAGRWQSAADKYTEALEVDPLNKGTNSKILQNRALCLIKLKQYDAAIADCDKAIQLDPSYTKARKTKANAFGQSGNWEEAVKQLKDLQEADPNDASLAKEVRKAELELKKSKRKDYYKILSLEKDANEGDIKKAYRKLAIIHHPDKNPDDETAAERFKDIGEAYETLSDPEKKAAYDRGDDVMESPFGGGGGMHGFPGGMDSSMFFEMMQEMNGGGGGGFGGGGRGGFHQGFPAGFGGAGGGGQSFHFG